MKAFNYTVLGWIGYAASYLPTLNTLLQTVLLVLSIVAALVGLYN